MNKLNKLTLVRAMIPQSDILSKKSQKYILGGYGSIFGSLKMFVTIQYN